MTKQEITLQGIDGQMDEQILTTNDETANGKLEDCARMLFPQEGETTPRLRFKGFEGEWKEATLGELFTVQQRVVYGQHVGSQTLEVKEKFNNRQKVTICRIPSPERIFPT